ncbi:signal peptidase II [Pedobacter namyangjuensis]|uniref:signal peptidase II n=1 Tax=Pedobacter namyangjuensis TaxID=600626 RepID=UPI000DE41341|nr:signal peptidase II [Pedobacter namyangjuensis]
MGKVNKTRLIILFAIICVNVALDQVSKAIVRNEISYQEQISIIENHFILTRVENTGAFLSAGHNLPEIIRFLLLTALPIAVLGYGLYFLISNKNIPTKMQIGISFLIGGGIGNIYDRIVHGSVTDFLFIDFGIFKTGIFNVADMSIMFGIGLLLLQSFLQKKAV